LPIDSFVWSRSLQYREIAAQKIDPLFQLQRDAVDLVATTSNFD